MLSKYLERQTQAITDQHVSGFLKANSHRHTRHEIHDCVVVSGVKRVCIYCPTNAFSIGVSGGQALPVRPPDALRRKNALFGLNTYTVKTFIGFNYFTTWLKTAVDRKYVNWTCFAEYLKIVLTSLGSNSHGRCRRNENVSVNWA